MRATDSTIILIPRADGRLSVHDRSTGRPLGTILPESPRLQPELEFAEKPSIAGGIVCFATTAVVVLAILYGCFTAGRFYQQRAFDAALTE